MKIKLISITGIFLLLIFSSCNKESYIIDDKIQLAVFPNPFQSLMMVRISSNYENVTLKIANEAGEYIIEKDISVNKRASLDLNLEEYKDGIYELSVHSESSIATKKIIKINEN